MNLEENVNTLNIIVSKICLALVESDILTLEEGKEILNTMLKKENKK